MIELQNIIPIPLQEAQLNPETQIWKQHLTFEKGKNYLVKAPSGKGKSTFLHLIYGLRTDYQGQINWNGQALPTLQEKDWVTIRQEQLAIVFQNLRLFPQLSALENIQININAPFHGQAQQIREMAKRLHIENLLDKPCQHLSYGQQQRVAIIRALMQPFSFLLLDEPFSHLDSENIEAAAKLITERVAAQKASLILVSLENDYEMLFDEILIL